MRRLRRPSLRSFDALDVIGKAALKQIGVAGICEIQGPWFSKNVFSSWVEEVQLQLRRGFSGGVRAQLGPDLQISTSCCGVQVGADAHVFEIVVIRCVEVDLSVQPAHEPMVLILDPGGV